ncbi:MAG: peptidoglycan-associated lipoprotein Pal [Candidatus Andeanibacterium colombiense]|uniref:Peptidoglycan-associated lipoprotein n=1 Tax=Candidatus Andeanibacterium colombiense TaxID=3121345 RepID=A0AAJ5XBS0_9SPHN|nr:MAG: peptidoglycan-associated lipoprotein Pal [Sphingomonadaceae bacterium]
MKRSVSTLAVTVMLAGALALGACSKKEKIADQLPPQPATVADNGGDTGPGPTDTVIPGSNADFLAQMNGRNVIYFDTDKFDVDSTDAAALRTQADWLMRYPNKRATIEGHCDERGTRDYNIALGERRANSAKNYLVSVGIDASRLTVVSYGKERPVALGSNEQAWAQNRRAATITID